MKLSIFSMLTLLVACSCSSGTPPAPSPRRATPASAPTPTPAIAPCPATDFPHFLQAFASDERVRAAYTAPLVQVTDWVDVDETERGTATASVPREKYRDFHLRYRDGAYVHVERDEAPEPIPVAPRLTARADGYRVEYIFNMSEGNSWLFARTRDCWQLVADPDPSLL